MAIKGFRNNHHREVSKQETKKNVINNHRIVINKINKPTEQIDFLKIDLVGINNIEVQEVYKKGA